MVNVGGFEVGLADLVGLAASCAVLLPPTTLLLPSSSLSLSPPSSSSLSSSPILSSLSSSVSVVAVDEGRTTESGSKSTDAAGGMTNEGLYANDVL